MTAADNNGGVLAYNSFPSDTQLYLSSVNKDGAQAWRTATPDAILAKYAVHPDGTISYLRVPIGQGGQNPPPAQVVALDPTTGQPRFSVNLPESSTTTTGIRSGYQNPITGQFYTICDPAASGTSTVVGRYGGLVIDGDGKLWIPAVANVTNKSVTCTPELDGQGNPVPWNGSGTFSYSYTSAVYLVSVTSAGASTTAQLDSSSGSGTNWNDPMPRFNLRNAIIPDGTGGVLVSVVRPDLTNPVYRSTGVQYTTGLSSVDQMLLGDNGTFFAGGPNGGVAPISLDSGSSPWQKLIPLNLTTVFSDGSIAVEDLNTGKMTRIDPAGQEHPLFDSSSAGGSVLTFGSASYFSFGGWAGALNFEKIGLAYDATAYVAASGYAEMFMNASGSFSQRVPTFQLVWCGIGPVNCSNLPFADSQNPDTNVTFTYYQDNPQAAPQNAIALTEVQRQLILFNAKNALGLAFVNYQVNIGEGRQGTNTVYVVGQYPPSGSCGITNPFAGVLGNPSASRIYYLVHMEQAQWALNVQTPQPTQDLLIAIGEGIGNNAAHEIAHQLTNAYSGSTKIIGGMGLDDDSTTTYNGGECSGSLAPWVFTGIGTDGQTPIHWGSDAVQSLTNILGTKP